MAIPAKYRERLKVEAEGELVLTIDTEEKCLLLYPMPAWEVIESKLEALPSFNPATRRIQRLLLGHATEIEMDSNGRFLVPSMLRDYADLDKRIVLVGQGRKFELWDESRWYERRQVWLAEEAKTSEQLPEQLQTLSL